LWKIDAVEPVVGGVEHAGHVQHVVLGHVLAVDPDRVRRCRQDGLHVVIEGIAIDVAEVVGFGDTQHHALHVVIVVAHDVLRRDLFEIPWPDAELEWLQHGILADPGNAAEQDRVVDFDGRELDAVGAVRNDVLGVVGVDPVH
jgi:hypothetical protein